MAKVDGSIGSLLQGVSQQPAIDRLPGQCTLMENMSADPVTGLTRRPPTDLVGAVGSAISNESMIEGWYNFTSRDGDKFIIHIHDGICEVADLNGNPKTVTQSDNFNQQYIETTGGGNLRFTTDENDITFITNTSVGVEMNSSLATYFNANSAIIQVLGAQFGCTYSISIDGSLRTSYTVVDGSDAGMSPLCTTTHIAQRLTEGLQTASGTTNPDGATSQLVSTGFTPGNPAYAVLQRDELILITNSAGHDFVIEVDDGRGGTNFKSMTTFVSDVADLPRSAPHLYAARIAQNPDIQDDMWFAFIADGRIGNPTPDENSFGISGYWQETVAPGVLTELKQNSMPVILTYADGQFNLSSPVWNLRTVGTDKSSPLPSFVGNTIRDVATFQGRTVFISGSSVCMSRTNRPYDFFRGSISALVDTDPIDVKSRDQSATFYAVVEHDRDLVIFSPLAQAVVFGQAAITPQTAALVVTTRFESNVNAIPVGAGRNVFFAVDFGRFTGIREFYTEVVTNNDDSRPVTQHVNRYINGSAKLLAASANYDLLLVETDATDGSLFVYQYIWNDDQKVQAAWSTWFFPHEVVYMFIDGFTSYFVCTVENAFYLFRMPLDVQDSTGIDYPIMLDQRFDVFNVNTTFELPFNYLGDDPLLVVQGEACPAPGMLVPIKSIDLVGGVYIVTMAADMGGGDVVVGTPYLSRYRPTMPQVKDASGVSVGTGKLRARNLQVTLSETGQITGFVSSKWGDSPEVVFDGRILGDIDNVIGEQPESDDTFILPFRQDVRKAEAEFYTSSHLPMTLLAIEWEGQYNKRGRRLAAPQGGNG